MSNPFTLPERDQQWLNETFARNQATFGGFRMETDPEGDPEGGKGDKGPDKKGEDQTFTQAELDRIIADRLKREREATKAKYSDYDDLKKKAEGAKTLEDRIAEVEQRAAKAETNALRSNIAAEHGISAEDRDLFLTGEDEETLTAQAKRLADREAERKKTGNHSSREGRQTKGTPGDGEMREFVRDLFEQEG